MPRPRSSIVKPVQKRLADGSTVTYYYDRSTGKSLGTDLEAAIARAMEAPRQPNQVPAGTLTAVILEYRQSSAFRKKIKPGTQKLYARYLEQIRGLLGDFAVKAITPAMIQDVREALQDQPAKANMTLAMLSIVLKFAWKRGYIASNPAATPGRLPAPKRTQIWSVADEDAFIGAARPSLRLGFLLFLYTVQRPSDCLAMTKGQTVERDGRMFLRLRQQKTDELLDVPVHARLAPLLRARLAERTDSVLLVPSPKGKPWRYRNFARAWDQVVRRLALRRARELFRTGWSKEQVRAELETDHRQRRDLRRTGIVRMAEAGATTPQIAAISGHSIDYCQRIIDTYLPRRTEVAIGGIEAWERGTGREPEKVVRLATAATAKNTRNRSE
jgi:integrase